MMSVKIKTIVETTKKVAVCLTEEDVIRLMRKEHSTLIPKGATVRVYVRVPGGGDWSNSDLEVDNETPLVVAWTENNTEVTDG